MPTFGNAPGGNGMQSSILPYQFHTRFLALYLQINIYGCRVVTNNIVSEVLNFIIYGYYLSTDCGSFVVCIAQTVYVLHHNKRIAICSIDVLTGVTCFLFYFEIDSLPSRNFFRLPSSRKFVFAISSPFQLNFIYVFIFYTYSDSLW